MPVEDAGSNLVTGDGSNSLTFKLPGYPRYAVQSVAATVDNGAGGATTATLSMKDTNGEVIAKTPQDDVIPAGDTGTATFALGLTKSKRGFLRWGTNTDPYGGGLTLVGTGGGFSTQTNGGGWEVDTDGANVDFLMRGGTFTVKVGSNGSFNVGPAALVYDDSGDRLAMFPSALSFFGALGVGQQPHPVTLADVIAVLTAFGLTA